MIYFLTNCVLDVTYGIMHWTSYKIFSYFFKYPNDNRIEDFVLIQENMLLHHTTLVNNYKNIIEQQQKQINLMLENVKH